MGEALGEPPDSGPRLVPVRLCRPGDALHGALRRYKDAPAVSAREHYRTLLASLLEEFLAAHGPGLRRAVGSWDALSAVPSSGRPGGARPFDAVVRRVRGFAGVEVVDLVAGSARAGHLSPSARAFRASRRLPGRRVLVVDDTWVTGARARSAAAALERAGAEVAGVLVLGRSVDPEAAPWVGRWWDRQLARATGPAGSPGWGGRPGEMAAAS